jgi:UDP-N-acetylmuramoyl-L-alanyl-D-glutamate--2,6-diaminopimelate ligase
MAQRGADAAVMEVTSHSLMLRRVGALELSMAAITNIVPDEHLEFHPTPEHYIATKARIFELLVPGAPVVVNVDDPIARRVTRTLGTRAIDVTMEDSQAHVRIRNLRMQAAGSTFTLDVGAVPPDARHRGLTPGSIGLRFPILGRQQVANAAIAATVALLAGGTPEGVATALANAEPMRRRMEVLRPADPFILDDTVGHPESIEAVFEAIRDMPRRSLHVVYAIRGMRGLAINERNAAALATQVTAAKAKLTVTASEDAADSRNVVSPEERDVVLSTLRSAGVDFRFDPILERAVRDARSAAATDDLMLLLGAQGMDRGREFLA